jgi:hypothetical protein
MTEAPPSSSRCGNCGSINPVWFAPNVLWNLVIGGPEATDDPGGILCPACFIERAESRGIAPTAWELRPEVSAPPPASRDNADRLKKRDAIRARVTGKNPFGAYVVNADVSFLCAELRIQGTLLMAICARQLQTWFSASLRGCDPHDGCFR